MEKQVVSTENGKDEVIAGHGESEVANVKAEWTKFGCQISVMTFGDPNLKYITLCHKECKPPMRCGFYDFCGECENRFECATQRR